MKRAFRRPVPGTPKKTERKITSSLESNLTDIGKRFEGVSELVVRRLHIAERDAAIVFLAGLQDIKQLEDHGLEPLVQDVTHSRDTPETYIARQESKADDLLEEILNGRVVIFVDKWDVAQVLTVQEAPAREVGTTSRERTIIGSNEAFTESLDLNIALVRTRLRTAELKTERFSVGTLSRTQVALMYLDPAVDSALVSNARQAIMRFSGEHLTQVTDFAEIIEEREWSPFPQTCCTERPDVAVGHLLEGRVVIFAQGSNAGLMAPVTFAQLLASPEDYYLRPALSTATRLLRFLALLMTLFAVPIYVALVSYHYDMIPIRLLTQIAQNRANVPFTPLTEALILDISVELLREAGIRLPQPLGQTLGVSAALVIGQSILAAQLVSPALVVAVGFTSIASFVIPNYSGFLAMRLLRFPITILAGFL